MRCIISTNINNPIEVKIMSSDRDLPFWIQNREKVLKNDVRVEWRGDKRPNYLTIDAYQEKKKYSYGSGFK